MKTGTGSLDYFSANSPAIIFSGSSVVFDPAMTNPGIDIPSNMLVIGSSFSPSQLSASGCAIGWMTGDLNGPGHYWDGQNIDALPGPAAWISDQGQVVGTDVVGNGYLWQSATTGSGTEILIQNLLPPVYQKRIANIYPWLISNANPNNNNATHIYFTANSLEGAGDGTWVNETFDLVYFPPNTSGSTPANTLTRVQASDDVVDLYIPAYQRVNWDGDFLAEGYTKESSNVDALKMFKIDFIPADSTEGHPPTLGGMVEQGYDPPQLNDDLFVNGVAVPQDQTASGALKPEWWTSVAGSGTSSVSQRIKIEFSSDSDAKACQLVVTTGSSAVTVTPTTFTSKETVLTITGMNTGQNNVAAIAQIFALSGTASLASLHIDVLPVRNINLGVYYVYDPNSVGTVLPTGVPDPNTIINQLNAIYQQACVTFTLAASGTIPIHYDLDVTTSGTGNGYLNSDNVNDPEFQALDTSGSLAGGKLNLVILGKLQHSSSGHGDGVLGETLVGAGYSTNKVYIYSQAIAEFNSYLQNDAEFFHVTGHEIGHALTLSSRNTPGYDKSPRTHDPGPFPEGPRNALMYPIVGGNSSKGLLDNSPYHWMRYEDWRQANDQAFQEHYVNQ